MQSLLTVLNCDITEKILFYHSSPLNWDITENPVHHKSFNLLYWTVMWQKKCTQCIRGVRWIWTVLRLEMYRTSLTFLVLFHSLYFMLIINGENCAIQSSIERSDQLRDSAVQILKINQKRMKFVFWWRHYIHFYEKMSLFAIYDISEDKFDNFLGCLPLQKHAQTRTSGQVLYEFCIFLGNKSCQMGSICKAGMLMQSQEIRGDTRKKYERNTRKIYEETLRNLTWNRKYQQKQEAWQGQI